MVVRFLAALLTASFPFAAPIAASSTSGNSGGGAPPSFATEAAAQKHCPRDEVVRAAAFTTNKACAGTAGPSTAHSFAEKKRMPPATATREMDSDLSDPT